MPSITVQDPSEIETFAVTLTDSTKTHDEWLAVVRFGLSTLMENQSLLIEVIVREAQREAERFNKERVTGLHLPSDEVASILLHLGLKLSLA